MAILNRDEFLNCVHDFVGDRTDDESMEFIDNVLDTYNDMYNKAENSGDDWKKRYEDNDKAWRNRYKSRFFHGGAVIVPDEISEENDEDVSRETITIEELFNHKRKGDR